MAQHAANVNHCIAKTIVTKAARTGRGIAVEKLTRIRDRARLRKPQRVTLSSWSFHQLGSVLAYKAGRAYRWSKSTPGTHPRPATAANTATSGTGQTRKPFLCRSCGVVAHADHNAALNIAERGAED